MRTIIGTVPLSIVLANAGLTAQIPQILAKTNSVVGVYAATSPTVYAIQSLPKDTRLGNAMQIRATLGALYTQISTDVQRGTVTAILRGSARGGGTGPGHSRPCAEATSPFRGTPELGFTFRSSRPVRGRIVAVMTPFTERSLWSASMASGSVRVAGHREVKASSLWALPVISEFGVVLDSTGTDVEVTLNGSAVTFFRDLRYEMKIELRFVPGHRVSTYGDGCIKLHSSFPNLDTVNLHVQSAGLPQAAFLLVGSRKIHVPIPPTWYGCTLLVDPLVVVGGYRTDVLGRLTVRQPVPNTNFDVLVQFATMHALNPVPQLTNGLELAIRKR